MKASSPKPDFSIESASLFSPVCGVDEAGRGPLAGPVVAAAVIFTNPQNAHPDIHDSKKLSAKKRKTLFEHITKNAITGIGICSAQEIDELNILNATMLAMSRAVEALLTMPKMALIDGNRSPKLGCESQCIVKGDQKSISIAAASILAKTTRDQIMVSLATQYPHYGFEKHAGYGTKQHLEALKMHGPCSEHRRSFAPIKNMLSPVV